MSYRAACLNHFSVEENQSSFVSGQNFSVECLRSDGSSSHKIESTHESILVVSDVAITLIFKDGSTHIPQRSLVIIPEGQYEISFSAKGRVFALTTGRVDLKQLLDQSQNDSEHAQSDPRVKPIGQPFGQSENAKKGIRVYAVDDIPHPVGNPRLKFFQTSTMSINWVEYHGPRARTKLSPHSHEDFEQGSLAISGAFIHHLRTPWGPNADDWREDQHLAAPPDSLLVTPPEIIHTTEGTDHGHSTLIDVFAPPRRDFIAKGWMHNAADYVDPEDAASNDEEA
jgi:hypothetical protein